MKIFIDTSNKDLFVSLVDNGKTIKYVLRENLVKKADALPNVFLEVLGNIKTSEITDFYITIGPGSFTGARTGLVFARSICQITKANLYTTSSLQMIAGPKAINEVFIDARSNKSYYAKIENGNIIGEIELIEYQESTVQNFEGIIQNPKEFMPIYKLEKNIMQVNPYYIKQARIGGK